MNFFLRPWLLSKFRLLLSKRAVGLLQEGDQPDVLPPPNLIMEEALVNFNMQSKRYGSFGVPVQPERKYGCIRQ